MTKNDKFLVCYNLSNEMVIIAWKLLCFNLNIEGPFYILIYMF